jgi:hypothetical protein
MPARTKCILLVSVAGGRGVRGGGGAGGAAAAAAGSGIQGVGARGLDVDSPYSEHIDVPAKGGQRSEQNTC